MTRAPKGGTVGANGEWYEGGKFVNTVPENSKNKGSKPKATNRKVEIEPFVWVMSEGRKPIFSIVGTEATYVDRYTPSKGIEPFADGCHTPERLAEVRTLCELFNAGERWM